MAKLPNPNESARPTPGFAGGPPRLPDNSLVEQANIQVGQSIAGLGESLAKAEIRDDKYTVEDATTQLKKRMQDLEKGDNGFIHTKSGDVVENKKFHVEHMGRYNSAAKEIGDSLGNDAQKEMYGRRVKLLEIMHGESLINHETKERTAFYNQAEVAGIETRVETAGSHYNNKNFVKLSIAEVEGIAKARADRLGLKGDARKQLILGSQTAVHMAVIKQALMDDKYEYAQAWFDDKTNNKQINGEAQLTIEKMLKDGGMRVRSQKMVDGYFGEGLTQKDAKDKARKDVPEGPLRDAVLGRIDLRYAEEQQDIEEGQAIAADTFDAIYAQAWRDTKSHMKAWDIANKNPDLAEQMDGGDYMARLQRMEADVKRGKIETVWEKWDEFEVLLEAGDITDVGQIRKYRPYFSDRDLRKAEKLFDKRGTLKVTEMRNAFIDNLGKSKSKWSENDKEQWLAFQEYALEMVGETRRPEDLTVWADRWFQSGESESASFWVNDPDTLGEAVTEGREEDFSVDIPDDDKGEIMSVMGGVGYKKGSGRFYTKQYLPAIDYLNAHDIAINYKSTTAVIALRMNNQPVTPANVSHLMKQIKRGS